MRPRILVEKCRGELDGAAVGKPLRINLPRRAHNRHCHDERNTDDELRRSHGPTFPLYESTATEIPNRCLNSGCTAEIAVLAGRARVSFGNVGSTELYGVRACSWKCSHGRIERQRALTLLRACYERRLGLDQAGPIGSRPLPSRNGR